MELSKYEILKLNEMVKTEGWDIFINKLLKEKQENALYKLISESKSERDDCRYKGKLETIKEISLCVGFEMQGVKQ